MHKRRIALAGSLILGSCDGLWGGLRTDNQESCVVAPEVCSVERQCNTQLGVCQPKLKVSGFTPARVTSPGGGAVAITGEGFFSGVQVSVGGVVVEDAVVVSSTLITGTLPGQPGCWGPLAVAVTGTDGKGAARTDLVTCSPIAPSFRSADLAVGLGPSLAVGEVNGDRQLDLLIASANDSTLTVLLGQGDGKFTSGGSTPIGEGPSDLAVGDINGDQKLDVLSADFNASTVSSLLGDGHGGFMARAPISSNIQTPSVIALADLDRDGRLDFVTANRFSDSLSLALGGANGLFQKPINLGCGSNTGPDSLAVADLNGDKRPDLVTGNITSGNLCIYLGSGGPGSFKSAEVLTLPAGSVPQGVTAAYLNSDARIDLAIANRDQNTVQVLLGNGDGTFNYQTTYPVAAMPHEVAVMDLNGDGRMDAVVAGWGTGSLSVLLGRGDGTFSERQDVAVGSQPQSVASGDFNGDGKPDLVVANHGSRSVTVLLNDFK